MERKVAFVLLRLLRYLFNSFLHWSVQTLLCKLREDITSDCSTDVTYSLDANTAFLVTFSHRIAALLEVGSQNLHLDLI